MDKPKMLVQRRAFPDGQPHRLLRSRRTAETIRRRRRLIWFGIGVQVPPNTSRLFDNDRPRIRRSVVNKVLDLGNLGGSSAQNTFAGRDRRNPPCIVALVNRNANSLIRSIREQPLLPRM